MTNDLENQEHHLSAGDEIDHHSLSDQLEEKGPTRRCVITREAWPKNRLIRFVLDPEGRVVEDLAGKLPGRGVHVKPEKQYILAMINQSGRLRKTWGREIIMPERDELLLRIGQGLSRRVMEGVGLARKIGALRLGVSGMEAYHLVKIEPLLLMAEDTARNTRIKVTEMIREFGWSSPLEVLQKEQYGAILNRRCVAVVAIGEAGIAWRLKGEVQRWRDFYYGS